MSALLMCAIGEGLRLLAALIWQAVKHRPT
jgi:hypothetical protein